MAAITRLEPSESIAVDCSAVATLFRTHGSLLAEDVLMGHVEQITDRIAALDAVIGTPGCAPIAETARMLSGLATEIGLTSLAHTLTAVAQAETAGNHAAVPALWNRVKRIGDLSLVRLWDMPQLRM